ncbi:MAG: hypothetical protein ABIF88_01245 [archaeon]
MELKTPNTESEYKASVDEKGNVVLKKKSEIKKGKKSKLSGGQFEMTVRRDLEEKGWIVDKWSNNFDLENGMVIPARRKFNPFSKVMTIGTGFPDFVCFQLMKENLYKIIGVEVKINGTLSRDEKLKCRGLLDLKIFSEIRIAKKVKEKNRVRVSYVDFLEVEKRMR